VVAGCSWGVAFGVVAAGDAAVVVELFAEPGDGVDCGFGVGEPVGEPLWFAAAEGVAGGFDEGVSFCGGGVEFVEDVLEDAVVAVHT
jgi:hypothetical protein